MQHSTGIVLCAGELSGDMHAAHVVRALRAGGASVTGMGGAHCTAAGMDVRYHHRDYAVLAESTVKDALERLGQLAGTGQEVALVLADQWMPVR